MSLTQLQSAPPEELLGALTDFERRSAPERLYLRGDDSLLVSDLRVAVVGSRRPSPEGLEWARRITEMLVDHDVTVVSGLALGIDSAAHETAISRGGRTIAVLGTSLDEYAVHRNRRLQDEIAANHLVVSQFPPGRPPHRSNFPLRNKTMAMLADATLIVEAGENSGTRHQGWEAIRIGRPVLFPKRFLDRGAPTWADEMVRYGAFAFNAHTLPLVLDNLPSRFARPTPVTDGFPF